MTWAVTFDFHNTIAECDEWFQLEVYDLVPAYLSWAQTTCRIDIPSDTPEVARDIYRRIRLEVMTSGREVDAAACLVQVLRELELPASPECVGQGLDAVFRPALNPARPRSGAIEAVRRLHGTGIPLAVVSSAAFHPFVEWTLEKFRIDTCFQAVITSAQCGHYKSSPRIYEAAARALDIDPRRCVHVGDSRRFDVESAKRAGMRAVLVDWDDARRDYTRADLRITSLDGLACLLDREFGISRNAD